LHCSEQNFACARIVLGIGNPQKMHTLSGFASARFCRASLLRCASLQSREQNVDGLLTFEKYCFPQSAQVRAALMSGTGTLGV
jgi:hypothetical protein